MVRRAHFARDNSVERYPASHRGVLARGTRHRGELAVLVFLLMLEETSTYLLPLKFHIKVSKYEGLTTSRRTILSKRAVASAKNRMKKIYNIDNLSMRVIGLTGSLGTGKSTVAGMFADLGAKVLSADKIAHQQITPKGACYKKVIRAFGKDILTAGRIDRRKVAARVFQNRGQLRTLEKIIHPVVRKVLRAKIQQYKKRKGRVVVVIDVPLLFESKLNRDVDFSIAVKTNRTIQMARIIKKLGMTKADAECRIKAQMPLYQKIRLADMTIDNNGTLTNTKTQVKRIWEKL